MPVGICRTIALAAGLILTAAVAWAGPVGERHLVTTDATAALRDAEHRPQVRVTVWYPAAAGSVEQHIDEGPPGQPFILEGAAAPDATFADRRRRPVILLSHGFGGAARSMAWFGLGLARAGYVVVAPDHPGNNGRDKMTIAGAQLFWDRAQDLAAALGAVLADPAIGPHIDRHRLGVAGFSAGGYTALVAAGARADPERLIAFCRAHPKDGICLPQKELLLTVADDVAALRSPALAGEVARAGDDHAIAGVRAVFSIAPAPIQELTPESLKRIRIPVAIFLGAADPIAMPATNGLAAARLIPHARLTVLPGVGHYDFLGECTPAGRARLPICTATVPQGPTLTAAIDAARAFFAGQLGQP